MVPHAVLEHLHFLGERGKLICEYEKQMVFTHWNANKVCSSTWLLSLCRHYGMADITSVHKYHSVSSTHNRAWESIRNKRFRFHNRYQLLIRFLIDSHQVLSGSALRVAKISKQHIKDIAFLEINSVLCGQMLHAGGVSPLCCDHYWAHYSKK